MASAKSIGKQLQRSLYNGDWAGYIDLQNLILLSLESLQSFIRKAEQNSQIEERDVESLIHYMTTFRISNNTNNPQNQINQIFTSIKYNSEKLMDLLISGNEEDLGLIPLIKNEILEVQKLLGNNPSRVVQDRAMLNQLIINYNQLKERKYQTLRAMLARNDNLCRSLISQGVSTVRGEVSQFLEYFNHFHKLFNENAKDEAFLMKFLEMVLILEAYRDNLNAQLYSELHRSSIPRDLKRSEVVKVVNNFFNHYLSPIADRLLKIKNIMERYNSIFIDIPPDERKEVDKLYQEFCEFLFKGVSPYENFFKSRIDNNKIKDARSVYENQIGLLRGRVAQKYSGNYNEGEFMSLVILVQNNSHSIFSGLFSSAGSRSILTINEIYGKLNDSSVSGEQKTNLLNIVIKDLEIFLKDDNGFSMFEGRQEPNTFIHRIKLAELKKEYADLRRELDNLILNYSGDEEDLVYAIHGTDIKIPKIANKYTTLKQVENDLNSININDFKKVIDYLKPIVESANIGDIINRNKARKPKGGSSGGSSGGGNGSGSSGLSDEDIRLYELHFRQKLEFFGIFMKKLYHNELQSHMDARSQHYDNMKNAINYFERLNSNSDKRNKLLIDIIKKGFSNRDISINEIKGLYVNLENLKSELSKFNSGDSQTSVSDVNLQTVYQHVNNLLHTFNRFGIIGNVSAFIDSCV